MKSKNFLYQMWTIAIGIWGVAIIYLVATSQINMFRHTLFVRQSLLSAESIISNYFARKLILSTMLLVLGIACNLVYLLAIEENSFLHVTRILFLSAGLISSAWEIGTMFYLDSFTLRIWIKSNDIFWILMTATSYSFVFQKKDLKYLRIFNVMSAIYFSLCCFMQSPIRSAKIITVYIFIFGTLLFVSTVFFIKSEKRDILFVMLFDISMVILNLFFANVRNGTNTREHEWNMGTFSYLLAIYAIVIFLYKFKEYQNRIFFNKAVNRKLTELQRYQNEMIDSTIEVVQKPLDTIYGLHALLLEKKKEFMDEEQICILSLIEEEVKKTRNSIINFRDNTMLRRNGWNMDKMKVSFQIIIETVLDILKSEAEEFEKHVRMHVTSEEAFIFGDPYYLMRMQINIMQMLQEIYESGWIEISICNKENDIQICLTERIEQNSYKKARKICKLFNSTKGLNDVGHEDDMPLMLARNLMLAQGGTIRSGIREKNLFYLEYTIPIWKDENEGSLEVEERRTGNLESQEHGYPIIILISTLREQIELIKVYLMMEPYKLMIFNTGDEALEYIENTSHIAMVFIGTTFIKMTSAQICNGIRKNYSLGQLPIILIRKNGFLNISESVRRNVNDILEEPFSRNEFLLKISSLLYLKKSVEDALRSRIDFLQSQMDPHFVFNTISTIMPLCLSNPQKAYKLLEYFSGYLRGNLFSDDLYSEVSIYKEMELIHSYLAIEKVRFEKEIDYSIDCNCDEGIKILPLMIEPLVENSVKHGRSGSSLLEITVDIIQNEDWVYIQVRDNGKGITADRIQEINDMSDEKSIGLANLRKRLKMWYNENLMIDSMEGNGTTVSFRIPVSGARYY